MRLTTRHVTKGAILGLVFSLIACGGNETKPPPPPPQPSVVAPPPPPPPPPPPTASAAASTPPVGKYTTEIIIHQAEIHGKIKLRAGKKLVVEPLVATSATVPLKGNKAEIFRVTGKSGTESDWLLIADGEIAADWVVGKNVEVNVTDEKKDALIDGKPAFHFAPGTMVRVRWQW